MAVLPENFPIDDLSTIERIQLEWFYSKFTEEYYSDYFFGHMMLAAYAAVPAYLTPDLLSKLWQNFGEYTWNEEKKFIHRMAIPDILLAPFCTQISYEVYQMDSDTRFRFLKWMNSDDKLWTLRKPFSIADIARFVEQYHNNPNDIITREGAKYLEIQKSEAQMYYNPKSVVNNYLKQLKELHENKVKNENEKNNEIVNLLETIEQARQKEDYVNHHDKNKTIFGSLFKSEELSLWKHSLLQNVHTLGNIITNNNIPDSLLSKSVERKENSIAITVEKKQTTLVSKFESALPSRKIALIIADSDTNITKIRKILEAFEEWNQYIIEVTKPISSKEENSLNAKYKITEKDHLLLYIHAKNARMHESHCYFQIYKETWISDSNISVIASEMNPLSFTLILDGALKATPYWMDTTKTGYSLFAFEQDEVIENLTVSQPNSTDCEELVKKLINDGQREAIRSVFVKTVFTNESTSLPNWIQNKQLIMMSNRETYFAPLGKASDEALRVQHLLRLSGKTNTRESQWQDQETDYALKKIAAELKINPNVYEVLPALQNLHKKNIQHQKPLFIFIFSDPEKMLTNLDREARSIRSYLLNSEIGLYNEVRFFKNREFKEIETFILHPDNRNRVQWIYYSGFDAQGSPNINGKVIDLTVWQHWLEFQNRIEMVILNTCNSKNLAWQLTQIGVKTAIGSNAMVMDNVGADFGIDMMKSITQEKYFFQIKNLIKQ
ncbi:hypothetical protein [Chryseobacterium viscerum]|uniref:CHAT domain-containing protein n=1 Tax=Chryseobacterium viscerum TaxID=1037377 RepID=A0A316WG92_9FLAO|nr:hypothetical protein [Chryseobacterium viscerum]PWN58038.1 hypothetical protein C1634_024730 [Chryseobacterium viscerum]